MSTKQDVHEAVRELAAQIDQPNTKVCLAFFLTSTIPESWARH